jgi:hypothetical protein
MNRNSGTPVFAAHRGIAGGISTGLLLIVVFLALGIVLAIWLVPGRTLQPNVQPESELAVTQVASESPIVSPPLAQGTEDEPPAETKRTTLKPRVSTAPPPTNPSAPPRPEPSPVTRQLVASLSQLEVGRGPITAEQAGAWKQTLQQLAEQKEAAIPAIREFLEKNVDINFDAEGDRKMMGASSLRLALLDTMQKIGGAEAMEVSLQMLQTTADPVEIATLARYLEQIDPGRYRDTTVNAAREALNVAASGQWDGRDVSPLLEILKQYGGPSAAQDLQKFGKTWFNYAPMVLATLPDGAGIPALIQWARSPEASAMAGNDIYLRMLAQTSTQYAEAFDTLVEQAAANRIPPSAWPGIADAIGGSTLELANPYRDTVSPLASRSATRSYHIHMGNQNFLDLPPPDEMSADLVATRLKYIDRLLASTSNPGAVQTLQNTRAALLARTR